MLALAVGILLCVLLLLFLFIVIGFFFFFFDLFLELPYVATNRKKIETIMKFADIKQGQTVVDLGSGDGRLLIKAATLGAFAVGYEINPFLIGVTLVHAKLKGVAPNVSVYKSNLWKADLKIADVVFVYAKRRTMARFEEFVYKNCQKGTRVVVNTNPFPGKKPIKEENGVFLYKV